MSLRAFEQIAPFVRKLTVGPGTTDVDSRLPRILRISSGSLGEIALRDIARNGERTQHAEALIVNDLESHLDVELAAELVRGAGCQRFPAQFGVAGGHGLIIAAPMRGPEMFRNDEIEALTNRFALCVAEDPFRTRIPQSNSAFAISENHSVGRLLNDSAIGFQVRDLRHGQSIVYRVFR